MRSIKVALTILSAYLKNFSKFLSFQKEKTPAVREETAGAVSLTT